MRPERMALHQAFLEDHRQLTRGLAGIRQALRDRDLAEAARLAEELDRRAGPHMEFEETVFYPGLRNKLGSEFVDRLYHEHDTGRSAVAALIAMGPRATPTEAECRRLAERVDTALDHAKSCGTLLSHLGELDEQEHAEMLEELLAARERGRRWTELERHPADDAG